MPRAVPPEDRLWQLRWLLAATCALMLVPVVLIVTRPTRWSWALLLWGVFIGLGGAAVLAGTVGRALRRDPPTDEQRAFFHRRLAIYGGTWIFFGALTGLVAAAFEWIWLDVALTGYIALFIAVGAVVYAILRRRTTHPPSSQDISGC